MMCEDTSKHVKAGEVKTRKKKSPHADVIALRMANVTARETAQLTGYTERRVMQIMAEYRKSLAASGSESPK